MKLSQKPHIYNGYKYTGDNYDEIWSALGKQVAKGEGFLLIQRAAHDWSMLRPGEWVVNWSANPYPWSVQKEGELHNRGVGVLSDIVTAPGNQLISYTWEPIVVEKRGEK